MNWRSLTRYIPVSGRDRVGRRGTSKASVRLCFGVAAGLIVHSLIGAQGSMADGIPPTPLRFETLTGWAADDHAAALAVFRHGCKPASTDGVWADLCRRAADVPTDDSAAARAFFEAEFVALRVGAPGFVTGYFEPEVAGSRTRNARFSIPLYAAPDDLVRLDAAERPTTLGADLQYARRTDDGFVEHPDRAAIERGALKGRGLELVWIEDPIDAFFIHIQGSARVRLKDGSRMRIAFAAKSGHAYTAIGRILIERGEISAADMTMPVLRDWLRQNRKEAGALMQVNRSYIFFREVDIADPEAGPIGGAGVTLTAGRSIAIDHALYGYGTPFFVSAQLPSALDDALQPFHRLMIAQDTGSAIKGPARGDLFLGSGDAAGALAGRIKHRADFVQLVPRGSQLAREAQRGRK